MDSIIIICILTIVIGSVSFYLYKEKKSGTACIGCPHGKQCTSKGKCSSHVQK